MSFSATSLFLTLLLLDTPTQAKPASPTTSGWEQPLLDQIPLREIGPSNMGGRVTDLAIVEKKPTIMYVGTASGGVWKTVNNGQSWSALFEQQATLSIGALAVAPSNPDILYVGTGEANPRNSVTWGNGVYKSSDAGKSWQHVGLADTHHIGSVVIHPQNPDIVYIAALGHLWGPNKERGIFKTNDAGKTWQHVLALDPNTGCVEVSLAPDNPNTLYACAWEVRRHGYSHALPADHPVVEFGAKGGLYRSTDAGKTWEKLTKGLPTRPIGRAGVSVSRKDPKVVYAIVSTDKTKQSRDEELGQAAKNNADPEVGGVFRSDDRGTTWTKLNDLCPRPFYFSKIVADPNVVDRVYVLGISLHVSTTGGKTFRRGIAPSVHADQHAMWINPTDSDHLILGNDGGVYQSYDRSAQWEHMKNMGLAQFYAITTDMRKPYHILGGLQDNGNWGGPSATESREGISTADWYRLSGADGFYCLADPTQPETVYCEGQYGLFVRRINLRTREEKEIKPKPATGQPAYRYNWSVPMLLSPHRASTVYLGANVVLKSRNRGDTWDVVSPDLTRNPPITERSNNHTITSLAESPVQQGVLWAGTDDGRLHVSTNDGAAWVEVGQHLPNLQAKRWFNRIECSRWSAGTAYVTVDRHREDDFTPYLYKTSNFGRTWELLTQGLPAEAVVHVVREDVRNKQLLFAGTERGLFISLDAGSSWHRYQKLPRVPVHDLQVHPRDRELVIGTHGRGIFIADIMPLEEVTRELLDLQAFAFDIRPTTLAEPTLSRGLRGTKLFAGQNPPTGTVLYYYLKREQPKPIKVTIVGDDGKLWDTLEVPAKAGLNRFVWDTGRADSATSKKTPAPPGYYKVLYHFPDDKLLRVRFRLEASE